MKNYKIYQGIRVTRDWLIKSKENSKEYKNSRQKEQPLPQDLGGVSKEEGLPPSALRSRTCWKGRGHGSLGGRKVCGALPVKPINSHSGTLGKQTLQGASWRVVSRRHSTLKLPQQCTERICWLLDGASCHVLQESGAEEICCAGGPGHWRSHFLQELHVENHGTAGVC